MVRFKPISLDNELRRSVSKYSFASISMVSNSFLVPGLVSEVPRWLWKDSIKALKLRPLGLDEATFVRIEETVGYLRESPVDSINVIRSVTDAKDLEFSKTEKPSLMSFISVSEKFLSFFRSMLSELEAFAIIYQ